MSKDQVEKSVETEAEKAAKKYANDECFLEGTPVWRDKYKAFIAGAQWSRAQAEAAGDCSGTCEKQAILEGSAEWEDNCRTLTQERDAYREALEAISVEADPEIRCKQSRLEELRSYAVDILAKFKKDNT